MSKDCGTGGNGIRRLLKLARLIAQDKDKGAYGLPLHLDSNDWRDGPLGVLWGTKIFKNEGFSFRRKPYVEPIFKSTYDIVYGDMAVARFFGLPPLDFEYIFLHTYYPPSKRSGYEGKMLVLDRITEVIQRMSVKEQRASYKEAVLWQSALV